MILELKESACTRAPMKWVNAMLIASDEAQISMIAKPAFEKRCQDEMHLRPWVSLKRISPTEIEMLPNRDSLQEDPTDPMDP